MNIDYEKIKKECPKSYKKFVNEYLGFSTDTFLGFKTFRFCDFQDFFDNNGIIISFNYSRVFEKFQVNINGYIFFKACKKSKKAKKFGIYKAFEIMEGINYE